MSMPTTPSKMIELGRKAPPFALPDVSTGNKITLGDFAEKQALLVMFICKHCPYVLHVKPALIQLASDYAYQSIGFHFYHVRTMLNVTRTMHRGAIGEHWPRNFVSLLYDETQEVAKSYRAACTPDFFLFDQERRTGLSRSIG